MRERLSLLFTLATGVLLVAVGLAFAVLQNAGQPASQPVPPEGTPTVLIDEPLDSDAVARGKDVYEQNACSLRHSIAGEGDPRYPLDGVGARRYSREIRDYIVPPETMRAHLPEVAFEMKQQYRELTGADVDAVVEYLRSLR